MARIKTSEVVQGIAGMAKNHLYSCWKGVGYLMSKPVSLSNPRSLVQQSVRAYTTFLSRSWHRDLTDAQRAGWDEYAQQLGSAAVSTAPNLGGGAGSLQVVPKHRKVMSGYNAFTRNNYAALEIGMLPMSPPVPNAPLGIAPPNPPTDMTCSWSPVPKCVNVFWTSPVGATPTQWIRVWTFSDDAGTHRQIVFIEQSIAPGIAFCLVKGAQGSVHPVRSMPGHYFVQVDNVDTYGQKSPPSNVCQVIVPIGA